MIAGLSNFLLGGFASILFILYVRSISKNMKTEYLNYAIGLIIAAIYVVVDIDLVTERYGYTYDDYIIASIQLYLDIMMIFVYIMSLFGGRD